MPISLSRRPVAAEPGSLEDCIPLIYSAASQKPVFRALGSPDSDATITGYRAPIAQLDRASPS